MITWLNSHPRLVAWLRSPPGQLVLLAVGLGAMAAATLALPSYWNGAIFGALMTWVARTNPRIAIITVSLVVSLDAGLGLARWLA